MKTLKKCFHILNCVNVFNFQRRKKNPIARERMCSEIYVWLFENFAIWLWTTVCTMSNYKMGTRQIQWVVLSRCR